MAGPEQRPRQPAPQPLELQSEPMTITDGERTIHLRKREKDGALSFQVKREETVIFTAAILYNQETKAEEVRLFYGVPTEEFASSPLAETTLPDTQHETTSQEQKEKEEPVILRGRIATDIRRLTSPTGGDMVRFQFAEHPNRALFSYWNVEPENERPPLKGNTAYRSVGAFDENVELVEGAEKGQEYDITCYKRTWKEPDDGKQKTVTGFQLVGLQKVTKRARTTKEEKNG
jgi:hypothetical protein